LNTNNRNILLFELKLLSSELDAMTLLLVNGDTNIEELLASAEIFSSSSSF